MNSKSPDFSPVQRSNTRPSPGKAWLLALLLATCAVLSLAGTDLVLPAVPYLPNALGGTLRESQYVLATFTAGTGFGLLLFGELGSRWDNGRMLVGATLAYAVLSALGALAPNLDALIALRFFQGTAAACAAVVAPGLVRALFDEERGLRAIGALGSVESLAPAVAPIIGAALFSTYGWTSSFWTTAVLAVLLAFVVNLTRATMPTVVAHSDDRNYKLLIRSGVFQRYALSHGLGLAALLAFVFAMPSVFVQALGAKISDFIVMQVLGISAFIIAANSSGFVVSRIGAERVLYLGNTLMLFSAAALLLLAILGWVKPWSIWVLFIPLNFGFGLRGPPGFYGALKASNGDDTRAAALVVLYVMLLTAAATAALAPFITYGIAPAAFTSLTLAMASQLLLWRLPALEAI
ncbi:MAG: MFS transporter [Pseudomonadota bacterium]